MNDKYRQIKDEINNLYYIEKDYNKALKKNALLGNMLKKK